MVFPYVEEHKFFCDYWFLTRWWNKIREFGALLARNGFLEDGEDVFQLSRYEVGERARRARADLGHRRRGRSGPSTGRRSSRGARRCSSKLGEWTPPPAIGVTPEAVTDPMTIMLWGVTTERVQEWARQQEGGSELNGAAASPGVVEGAARVVRTADQIGDVRDGEILVCGSTSPAWAPIFSKIKATVTDVGGVMSHAAIVCREYGLPAVVGTGRATSQIRTGQTIRVDGTDGVVTWSPTRSAGDAPSTRGRSSELRGADEPRFGGKSASLGELLAAEIPVPPGFALSIDAFEAFVREAGLGATIDDGRARAQAGDVDAVAAASRRSARRCGPRPCPTPCASEVAARYAELGDASPVAVRSSAVGEDSEEATFAGQQETYLWVRGVEPSATRVRDCWISLYSPPAITYRARLGEAEDAPAMGVTVQLMVDAEVSGVMFTCNPVSGDPSMVAINASWGLGLAVVGGEVTPDDFLRQQGHRRGRARERRAPRRSSTSPDARGCGTMRVEVPEDRREPRVPRRRALARLVEVAQAGGAPLRLAPGHRVGDRAATATRLFVVQSRPVTGLAEAEPRSRSRRRRCRC